MTITVIGVGLMLRWLFDRPSWDARRQTLLTGALVLLVAAFWAVIGIAKGEPLTITVAAVVAAFEVIRQITLARETATVTDLESRNAFTFTGLTLMLFWGTPFGSLDWIVPELSSNIEMFFVSGVCLVLAAVWVIVYNSDLITDAMTAVFGRYSRIRPALKTAIAYPLDSRLRTGTDPGDARPGHLHAHRHVHAEHGVRRCAVGRGLCHRRLGHHAEWSATTTP